MAKRDIMDDERYKREYNNVRDICLCKDKDFCSIPMMDAKTHMGFNGEPLLVQRSCVPDKYLECPLFVFMKKCIMHRVGAL